MKRTIFVMTRLSAVGISGWLGGMYFERYKHNKTGIVNAAGPATSTALEISVPPEPAPTANRVAQIMRFGFPGMDNVRSLDNYILSFDRRTKVAHWVFEHLTSEDVKPSAEVDRSVCEFREDPSIHPYFRTTNSDYKRSGYDRGHLAAAGNHRRCQKHVDQTFFLTNIAPQVGEGFNRSMWNNLEKHVRRLARRYKNVYVCTGPLYLPRYEPDGKRYVKYEVIGSNDVAVPTHFFKVVVAETENHEFDLESYVMPNAPIDDNTPLNYFFRPLESIERAAGLLLFDKIHRKAFRMINGHPNQNP